jgi:phosphoribosylformylglycinamidine synthase
MTPHNSASAVLILHASGANRDGEAARAIALAGGEAEIVHINQLRSGDKRLADYGGVLLPGGFSYGDALGAGARLALDMQVYLHDQLHAFVGSGRPVLGICNGFQALVKAGLLPGPAPQDAKRGGIEAMARRRVTLTENVRGGFECRWVYLAREDGAASPLLAGVDQLIFCPVAHGEGNFQVQDETVLAQLAAAKLVALRYVDAEGRPAQGVYPHNPNGSAGDIAGICNHAGNVLGLMPHPEDHVAPIQNPLRTSNGLGLPLFAAFVRCVKTG